MALSKERQGEIAMIILQHKLEKEGELKLIPSEVKRQLHNSAKNLGIPASELAEFVKITLEKAYAKTVAELDVIASKVEE